MRIDLQIDNTALVLRLPNGRRQLAYAVVNAINNRATRIWQAEHRRVEKQFTAPAQPIASCHLPLQTTRANLHITKPRSRFW